MNSNDIKPLDTVSGEPSPMNTNAFLNRLWEQISRRRLILPGETVLCAVSGGADSLCLLHALAALAQRFGFTVTAASFDHQIRPESAEDIRLVRETCQTWGLPCHTGSENVPAAAAAVKQGLEATARELRYAFLEETAQRIGADRIATAHTADDNAETVLLHLLRGSGLKGLGGIPPTRGRIIRPLLWTSREEVEAYCAAVGISYVTDATNADERYTRNYLRRQVLPLLKARNPHLLTTLGRTAETLRRDSAYLDAQAREKLAAAQRQETGIAYPVRELLTMDEALSSRVVQAMAEQLVPGTALTVAQRELLLDLCRSEKPGAEHRLNHALTAHREYERLVLRVRAAQEETGTKEQTEAQTELCSVTLFPGQTVTFHGRLLTCREAICPPGHFNQKTCYYLRPVPELLLRAPQRGDHITLPGRPGKRLKKLFTDEKIPRHQRPQQIVLEAENRVAALDGWGADQAFLPEPGQPCWCVTSEAQ